MFIHFKQCLWALKILWQYKSISKANRLLLWKKSIRLYLSLLAFMDQERPENQLQGGMISAVITAVYDYETDWVPILNPVKSRTFALLNKYVADSHAQKIAHQLFANDLGQRLSADGLERGSVALTFYRALIQSRWMSEYSSSEINTFGRSLQMVDDLLDYEDDQRLGHTNCFLTPDQNRFLKEARAFLKSDFFQALVSRSIVYQRLELECKQMINRIEGNSPSWSKLFNVGRPKSSFFAGALALTCSSLVGLSWQITWTVAVAYTCISMSIMMLNDLIDRHHDAKRGKTLACDHTWRLFQFWTRLSKITMAFVLVSCVLNIWVGLFILGIWLLGLGYSFVPHWYIVQNLIVAFCVASPALCVTVPFLEWRLEPLLIFGAVFGTIWMREIVKDIEHIDTDAGYKETIPVRQGHIPAVSLLFGGLWAIPVTLLVFYPSWPVKLVGLLFCVVQFSNANMLLHPQKQPIAIRSLDIVLTVLVTMLLIAP